MNLEEILKPFIDLDYKKFHERLCHTKYKIEGIRIPTLRKIAKDLAKEKEVDTLIKDIPNNSYELVLLKGLIIGYAKIPLDKKLKLIDDFVPLIDNWAINDTFCSTLKIFKTNQDELYPYLKKYLYSNQEYYIRFGLVILLDYYINDEYLKELFLILDEVDTSYYYTHMAAAWLLSYLFIKYYDETIEYLKVTKLGDKTINEGIKKACESFRIPEDKKTELKKLKK